MMNLRADSFVFIVHDEPDARQTLSTSFQTMGLSVESYASGEEFLTAHDPEKPGCVVMHLHLSQMRAIEVLQTLANESPVRDVILLADHTTLEESIEHFRVGAIDLFLPPVPQDLLIQRIQAAIANDIPRRKHYARWLDVQTRLARLSPPELEVVQLLTEGLLNKQIAARLNVAVRTIELRRANIFKKMEVASLGDLLRLVIFLEIYSQGTLND